MTKLGRTLLQCLLLALLLCLNATLAAAQASPDPYADVPKSRGSDGAFILGDPAAGAKLIEFSDFLCGSCQNYEPIIASFVQDFVLTGQAQFEYRIFPVVDPQLSVESSSLVECADTLEPGAFWRAHDLMFEIVSEQGYAEQSKARFADSLGMQLEALSDCALQAKQYAVDANYGFGMGVSGTPSLFVQYGDSAPLPISLPLPEHFPALVNALRPASTEPVTIEFGAYAGLSTQRTADGGFALGHADAPLTIVAFEDFLCGHCQSYTATLQQFIDEQVRAGAARFEYRFYPLINPEYSTTFAKTAECVAELDQRLFWDAHDLLFDFAAAGSLDNAPGKIAKLLDLDAASLTACLDRAVQFLVDTKLGQDAQVSGTPAIRARDNQGQIAVIFNGDQPLDRGGVPLDLLNALAEGAPGLSVGPPEPSLLNDAYLRDDGLLTGEPCAPPCWQHIKPGETAIGDAMKLVAALESFTILQGSDSGFLFEQNDGAPCCQVAAGSDGIVSSILLQFAPTIALGDALAVYGEPEFVSGQPFTPSEAVLLLYYPARGMALYVVVPGIDGQLEAASPVVSAVYATEAMLTQAFGDAPFDHWKGYLKYSDYMDGEFDYQP